MRSIVRVALIFSLASAIWCFPAWGQAVLDEEYFLKASASTSSPGAADALALDAEAAGFRQRSLWPNPELGLDNQPSGDPGSLDRVKETTLVLTQQIPLFTYPSLRAQAAHGVAASEGKRSEAASRWRLAVRQAYAETLLRQEEMAAIETALSSCRAMRDLMAQRKLHGDASGLEEVRVGLELEALIDRYEAVRESLVEAKRALLAASGVPAPGGDWAVQPIAETAPLDLSLDGARELALKARGLLRERRAQRELSLAERREATASSLPELSLFAGYKRAEDPLVSDRGLVWGFGLSIPIFDRGQHRRAAAAAKVSEADIRARLAEAEVLLEVESSFARYARIRERSEAYERGVFAKAGRIAETAYLAFEAGEMTLLEYLDAVRTALDAHLRRSDLRAAYTKARIALEAATGAPVGEMVSQATPVPEGALQ